MVRIGRDAAGSRQGEDAWVHLCTMHKFQKHLNRCFRFPSFHSLSVVTTQLNSRHTLDAFWTLWKFPKSTELYNCRTSRWPARGWVCGGAAARPPPSCRGPRRRWPDPGCRGWCRGCRRCSPGPPAPGSSPAAAAASVRPVVRRRGRGAPPARRAAPGRWPACRGVEVPPSLTWRPRPPARSPAWAAAACSWPPTRAAPPPPTPAAAWP